MCPITKPANRESGMASSCGWLPKGLWIDYFTGTIYEGGRWFTWYRGIESIPVFLKAGGILALDGRKQGNEIDNPDILEVCVNALGDGEFTLMEDDGKETEYVESRWCQTVFRVESKNSVQFTIMPARGNLDAVAEKRSFRLRFYGLGEIVRPVVLVGEIELPDFEFHYENRKGILEINLSHIPVQEKIRVELGNGKMHDNQKKERVFDYLNQAQITFEDKESIYHKVCEMEDAQVSALWKKELMELPVCEEILEPVMEIFSACPQV